MSVYLDTSVLISIYYPEPITPKVRTFLTNQKGLSTSLFSLVEFSSAVNKKILNRELPKQNGFKIINRFQDDIEEGYYKVYPFSPDDLTGANNYIKDNLGRVSLRTVDSIHIAIALRGKCDLFVTADKTQAESAKKLGLETNLIT